MRVGLISDTHLAGRGWDLPSEVLTAFDGVDLILHCGDLECLGVLDCLETVAPVLAVRGYEDPTEPGDRLAAVTRVVQAEGIAIGMIHDIQWPGPRISTTPDGTGLIFPEGRGREIVARKFGQQVDIVVFGDTHHELVCYHDGVLLINPGSPTYPGRHHHPEASGTLGLLEIEGGTVQVRLLYLTPDRPQG
ncbi:MAG: metallophosphoesterase family protein [Dehalococcoidia bacterium]|jgi:hypothetical protein|nr:metallophosphoesterase family protein [Dehalococcoidia bacterium]